MKSDANDLLFEVLTPIGFKVRVTKTYWQLIISTKHPTMAGRESDIRKTLENPDEVRLSRTDAQVYLFYKTEHMGRWVCGVSKRLEQEGFLITAYPTDAIKEGNRVWPK